MIVPYYDRDGNFLYHGDCIEVLKELGDASVDSIVTDPPYGISFMGKGWDHGVPSVEYWKEMLRISKPGTYLLAFGGTRTFHRLTCAIEDAGWEIRDCIMWVYGSGFPKSLDVSKAIDKAAGAEREIVGQRQDILKKQAADIRRGKRKILDSFNAGAPERNNGFVKISADITAPSTDDAKQWHGWGTSLKPAWEPIIVARKPVEGTVTFNVLKHGTGALNIDGCRVELNGDYKSKPNGRPSQPGLTDNYDPTKANQPDAVGRWPANLIHDGSDEVVELFPDRKTTWVSSKHQNNRSGEFLGQLNHLGDQGFNGDGSAARFFYCAKASASERGDTNTHPTVKPIALMEYLCRLVTPVGGVILDPFMGSGTTCLAAKEKGFKFVGIDKTIEYCAITANRLKTSDGIFGL